MSALLLDTNCLLSYVTDRDLAQQALVNEYFQDAASFRCELSIINSVAMEFVFVLKKIYKQEQQEIAYLPTKLHGLPGVTMVSEAPWSMAVSLWPTPFRDYGDAVLAATASHHRLSVITFDQHFRASLIGQRIGCILPKH